MGSVRLLEAIRLLGMAKTTRFYQASTSELYGKVVEIPAKRAHAVLSAFTVWRGQALRVLDYRELSRVVWHVCLQWHSVQPRVTIAARRPSLHAKSRAPSRGRTSAWKGVFVPGNLDALRDWGHAKGLRPHTVDDAAAGAC